MTTTDATRIGTIGRARLSVAAAETLAAIRREARTVATPDERVKLAGWSGWGPLAPAFAPKEDTWAALAERISAALPTDDLQLGMQGTYNSFYTPEPIAHAMWEILLKLGFTGGKVLEPGCGRGVFMNAAPASADMVGVDRDRTSADIARLLHPAAKVITGQLQDTRLGGGYAAAIGNVPFADLSIFDPSAPKSVCSSLHDYFIWRAVDALAPGGVAVLLTSRYTMDKSVEDARLAIGVLADLVQAFRLPNGALGGGTDIVADVLVLRKRTGGISEGHQWWDTTRARFGYNNPVNKYWDEHPGDVLGEMKQGRTGQYGLTIEVAARDGDQPPARQLTEAAGMLATDAEDRRLCWQAPVDVTTPPDTAGLVTEQGWHNGSIHAVDDAIFRVENGQLTPIAKPSQELRALIGLRDLAVQLVAGEANHDTGDRILEPLRVNLAGRYAAYVRKFGALNRSTLIEGPVDDETGLPTYSRRVPPMGGFRHDPDAALTFALEVYDDETGQAGPAPILKTRQNLPVTLPTSTRDPKQALAWSMNYRAGQIDLDYMARLLGVDDPQTIPRKLGDAVYQDPGTHTWLTAEEYLSGNVRVKLSQAQQAAAHLPQFTRNVEALLNVQPTWQGPGDIGVNLGSPWIGAEDIAAFVRETLRYSAAVRRVPQTAQWEVEVADYYRRTPEAEADWGTVDVDAYRLVELALNGKVPVVYRTITRGDKQYKRKDSAASMLASEKQAQLKERFAEWLWECPDRTDRLVDLYNHRFNALVARRFSGKHVTVAGLAPWFNPYDHQREFVARAIVTPASLCGHPVGAGKTATMAMTAMKLRQLGLARKPMVVVPNHLIEQIDREFRQLFPGARIMSASSATVAANRRGFNARVATQEWDIILVTHSAFDRMGVSPQTEEAYVREQLDELTEAIIAASPDGRLTGRMVKQLAKRRDQLEENLEALQRRAKGFDLGLTFEAMGVDFILLDEAHYYKNLAVPVRIDGFSVRPSKRATALEIKMRWLAKRGGGRYAALFTGTPVSNTMLELYVVLRYLMQDHLRELGLGTADAWAQLFVQFVTSVDVTVDGGQFQLVTRPALFVNAPELRMLLSQVADIRTAQQLGLKRPAWIMETVVCGRTRVQAIYSDELVKRAEAVKGWSTGSSSDDGEKNDNMLAICGDGRRMATDPALVGLDDPEPGKLHKVAANMVKIWREHPDTLQIGFLDVGTPNDKKGSQTYGRLRRLLIDRGMPARQIRFIHDAKGDGDKAQLFSECRASGKVSVILGSTDKLGVGTNIQTRVKAMHHIDGPWRPADVEQRDGRGLRPGNRNTELLIFRYVTERTFDAYTWQLLTRKIGFISQILSGNVDRTIEDISADVVDAYAAVKAAAAGQPLLMEKAKVDSDVKRLRMLQRNHKSTGERLLNEAAKRKQQIETDTRTAQAWEAIATAVGDVEDLDEDDETRLHEHVKGFRRWAQAQTFAGVQVNLRTWATSGEEAETHPLLHIRSSGANAEVQLKAYSFWTPQRLARAFTELLRSATTKARGLRQEITQMQDRNASAEISAARPFDKADELTAAQARLDQINAALQAAAVQNPDDEEATDEELHGEPEPTTVPVQRGESTAAPEPEPADDLAGLFGAMMADYDTLTRDVFGAMMAAA